MNRDSQYCCVGTATETVCALQDAGMAGQALVPNLTQSRSTLSGASLLIVALPLRLADSMRGLIQPRHILHGHGNSEDIVIEVRSSPHMTSNFLMHTISYGLSLHSVRQLHSHMTGRNPLVQHCKVGQEVSTTTQVLHRLAGKEFPANNKHYLKHCVMKGSDDKRAAQCLQSTVLS